MTKRRFHGILDALLSDLGTAADHLSGTSANTSQN